VIFWVLLYQWGDAIGLRGDTETIRLRTPGLVVKADGSRPRGRGFKPWHCIFDGCKRFTCYYVKEKFKIKVVKWGTPKKIFQKKVRKLNIKNNFQRIFTNGPLFN
jgi:hypothetical protein